MAICRRPETPQCQGKSRNTQQRCQLATEPGSKYCRFHGGRLPKGPANHFYKHGGYAQNAPKRMREDLLRIAADKDLLRLTEELTLMKARAQDVLSRVDTGESGKAWKTLRSEMKRHDKALRAGDVDDQADAIWEMRRIIEGGSRDWEAWDDLRSVIRDVTRLAESERRYALEQHHMISVEVAYAMMVTLMTAVRGIVADEHTRNLVADEFERLTLAQLGRNPAVEAEVVAA